MSIPTYTLVYALCYGRLYKILTEASGACYPERHYETSETACHKSKSTELSGQRRATWLFTRRTGRVRLTPTKSPKWTRCQAPRVWQESKCRQASYKDSIRLSSGDLGPYSGNLHTIDRQCFSRNRRRPDPYDWATQRRLEERPLRACNRGT